MKVSKPILAGLISLASLAPCKAQRAVQLVSETGFTGVIAKQDVLYSGMNFCFNSGKKNRNYTDLYAGINVPLIKDKPSFVALAIDNYTWTKNISSWARGVFSTTFGSAKSTLEVAPVRVNEKIGKFNFSFGPSYAIYHNFKDGTTTQGFNPILQATYNVNPKVKIFSELKYTTEPAENLFDTKFGKFKDNLAYMVACMINL